MDNNCSVKQIAENSEVSLQTAHNEVPKIAESMEEEKIFCKKEKP